MKEPMVLYIADFNLHASGEMIKEDFPLSEIRINGIRSFCFPIVSRPGDELIISLKHTAEGIQTVTVSAKMREEMPPPTPPVKKQGYEFL